MIITIGRQLGSGGSEIGKKLSKEMNIAYYDKNLITLAAQKSGLSKDIFEQADERMNKGVPAGLFGMRFPFLSDNTISYGGGLSSEMLFKIQSDVMRDIANKQSCVFIGRCADYVLRERKDCLNIFICANDENRVKRIISHEDISIEEARELLVRVDKKRSAFYNYYSNKTWGASESYHLCINSSVFGINGTVTLLKNLVGIFHDT